eukprot:873291-Pyramimonas_sp.AAC.1
MQFDRASKRASVPNIQVFPSCPKILTKLLRCKCTYVKEHQLDWHGHDQQYAVFRNKTTTIRIAQLVGKQ